MSRKFKLLVRDPVDELESIVEVSQSGKYFDPARVLHDERVDGPLSGTKITQVGTLRGGQRAAKQTITDARNYLLETNWYVIRQMETGKVIPPGIVTQRATARTDANQD